jgi:hypothetical protein
METLIMAVVLLCRHQAYSKRTKRYVHKQNAYVLDHSALYFWRPGSGRRDNSELSCSQAIGERLSLLMLATRRALVSD